MNLIDAIRRALRRYRTRHLFITNFELKKYCITPDWRRK